MKIKVVVAGARGRMGSTAIEAIEKSSHTETVAALDYKYGGLHLHKGNVNNERKGIPIYTSMAELMANHAVDVLLDVTDPDAVFNNVKAALSHGVRPVVGTSGLSRRQVDEISVLVETYGIGCVIAPNFSIGAVLMMKFAAQAAHYLGDIEIIEMHHDRKLDAPSGTALKTAEMIQHSRPAHLQGHPDEQVHMEGARGADIDGMKIHSVRLPGLLAHQQVLLGGEGELLTLRHDSFDRKSFMPGIVLSIRNVVTREDLVYGLEYLID